MLASTGAMLVVALAVPGAFGDDAVLFGVAYLFVRLLHLVLSTTVGRDDPDRRGAIARFAPTAIFGALTETHRSRSGCSRLRSTTSARS
jgi:low temperature requirement protein LtrA